MTSSVPHCGTELETPSRCLLAILFIGVACSDLLDGFIVNLSLKPTASCERPPRPVTAESRSTAPAGKDRVRRVTTAAG